MANFLSDIWESVFHPGTNRSLVIATYASFAALQATLFALLVATRSYHFVFLSIICACLWITISWFINELEAVKKVEAEAERLRKLRQGEEEEEAEEEEVVVEEEEKKEQ